MLSSNNNPWSIQLELAEGCNRRCSFCGIHSLYREKKDVGYKYMTVETARLLARDMSNWLPKIRLEFALQGEPLLNPKHLEIFQIFREEFPKCQIMVTTNTDMLRKGKEFDPDKISNIFKSGVNIMVADYYGEKNDMPYAEFCAGLKKNSLGIPVYDFHKDKPTVYGYVGSDIAYIVSLDNTNDRGVIRTLNNQAGNTDPDLIKIDGYKVDKLPMEKRCHLPFREMAIKYDGVVPICCMDWQRETLMGKFPEKSLEDIWQGGVFRHTRNILYQKQRGAINPCDRCDIHANKVGLVKDPFPTNRPTPKTSAEYVRKHQDKKLQGKYADKPFVYTDVMV